MVTKSSNWSQTGHKNLSGTVGIFNYKGRVRLRWSYQSKRYSLNLSIYSRATILPAKMLALQIEQDMSNNMFDRTLKKYKAEPQSINVVKTIVSYFEEWVSFYKQMDCDKHTNYNSTRGMLIKWGDIQEGNIQKKLGQLTNAAVTYNRRLTILKSFAKWLVKKGVWTANPLEDINPKKVKKAKLPKRAPFTVEEIHLILEAIKNDTYTPKCSSYKHSHYYPFIYFLFKTGVRNAEAIGLRVSSIDVKKKQIHIKEVLARTLKSGSTENRVRKETKNGKERILPLTPDLYEVLEAVIKGKKQDELVFHSPTGKSIDDHNFQNRIFKPVLKHLGINERVLYACRHTFGSRCIDAGITPVMTAFLMGNNPETALRNYTHQITIPKDLPSI
jgi:integrase